MTQFTLISRPTLVFKVVKKYLASGFIPSVKGVSVCGRFQTYARIADVVEIV